MKNINVILAFHAHELLWDLPEKLLSYLPEGNPMKDSLLDENYLKKRKEEGRDIYRLCSNFGDSIGAPMCVEYSNELLVQIKDVMPEAFERLCRDYQRGRLYPVYGHAHHAHVSLLHTAEITQEIMWNSTYLHAEMRVPYPKYKGLFPTEDSLDAEKMEGIARANIDYVIFPHLNEKKAPYQITGESDCIYNPFWVKAKSKKILALPRNFPISQEIWRPITKMKRDEVKAQGYMLGEYAVFNNEYLSGEKETYPITMEAGVELYRQVLLRELKKAPENGLLLYVQDLELMDFGDIALEIMEKAWESVLSDYSKEYTVRFMTPDEYIDKILAPDKIRHLPTVSFEKITWAPEIRLVLRADGHYPPLGVTGTGRYEAGKTGIYKHPHVFWENGKYFCGIFDSLMNVFAVTVNVPADIRYLGESGYDLAQESIDTQAVIYLRLMKRACNWGWRPTEGRQKRPCLLGYLLCDVFLKMLLTRTAELAIKTGTTGTADNRCFVGLCETLQVFIDNRVNYLKSGIDEYIKEKGGDFSEAYRLLEQAMVWRQKAWLEAKNLYELNQKGLKMLEPFVRTLQSYALDVYMATECIQRVWSKGPDSGYLVEKMYHYLYRIYPPIFPAMIERIDAMPEEEIGKYFQQEAIKALIQ